VTARNLLAPFRELTPSQRHAFTAAWAGWALDAFDFFIFIFALKAIAADFHTTVKAASEGIFLTLAMRPVGALLFGWLAERYGRRPVLMVNVVSFSVFELASAFAPDLRTLLFLRALFGFAMGGEWGVGAALALESLPAKGRGLFSGILQEGYVVGYLLASALFAFAFPALGWRGMFVVGASPALLVLYIRQRVDESPAWRAGRQLKPPAARETFAAIRAHLPAFLFMVALMAFFNAFSHGSQDLYPTFLQTQQGFSPQVTGTITIIYNIGALMGGIVFGSVSERLGRRRRSVAAVGSQRGVRRVARDRLLDREQLGELRGVQQQQQQRPRASGSDRSRLQLVQQLVLRETPRPRRSRHHASIVREPRQERTQ